MNFCLNILVLTVFEKLKLQINFLMYMIFDNIKTDKFFFHPFIILN